ncbi:hypothetical protein [Streptomyces sp. NBC_01643]|uniref:LppU/SCO3897 family protein n=1 Tax=Streptomyces sp. NBC_01643 TaxID=2975906 RepID=UPI00387013C7|nr:hypothetical protein OHB03_00300 [Streptomyces sp. NBC_01643]WTD38826.1 hypothetical protein OHB03_45975 [Streptomyces sp. NBC_01643]
MTTPPPPGRDPHTQPLNAPYGHQGGNNPYSHPAAGPAPARRMSLKGIVRGVGGVVVAAVVVFGIYETWFAGAATADAGDCLNAANWTATSVVSVGDPEFEIVDCGDPKAEFKVMRRESGTDGTCDPQHRRYTQGGSGRDFTLCLDPVK